MKTKILLLALTFSIFGFSCSKDDDKDECVTDMSHIAGNYKITAATYKSSPTATPENIFNELFELCERDDIVTLNANGTGVTTDAGTKCNPDGSYSFNWSLSGNNIIIDSEDWTVKSFNCQTLLLNYSNSFTEGDLLEFTFTRQ